MDASASCPNRARDGDEAGLVITLKAVDDALLVRLQGVAAAIFNECRRSHLYTPPYAGTPIVTLRFVASPPSIGVGAPLRRAQALVQHLLVGVYGRPAVALLELPARAGRSPMRRVVRRQCECRNLQPGRVCSPCCAADVPCAEERRCATSAVVFPSQLPSAPPASPPTSPPGTRLSLPPKRPPAAPWLVAPTAQRVGACVW